ncbi:MAG: hypothetical protein ACJ8FY_12605 [Gemmataceae bacterium]
MRFVLFSSSLVCRAALMAAAFSCLSCSSSEGLNQVHGKVLYKNQPLQGVVLTFHPNGADINTVLPVGLTKEDGTFTVTTGQSEGAPAGEYIITAICPQPTGKARKGMTMERSDSEDRFKGAYAREATSTIKVEIKKDKNELEPINLQ